MWDSAAGPPGAADRTHLIHTFSPSGGAYQLPHRECGEYELSIMLGTNVSHSHQVQVPDMQAGISTRIGVYQASK